MGYIIRAWWFTIFNELYGIWYFFLAFCYYFNSFDAIPVCFPDWKIPFQPVTHGRCYTFYKYYFQEEVEVCRCTEILPIDECLKFMRGWYISKANQDKKHVPRILVFSPPLTKVAAKKQSTNSTVISSTTNPLFISKPLLPKYYYHEVIL